MSAECCESLARTDVTRKTIPDSRSCRAPLWHYNWSSQCHIASCASGKQHLQCRFDVYVVTNTLPFTALGLSLNYHFAGYQSITTHIAVCSMAAFKQTGNFLAQCWLNELITVVSTCMPSGRGRRPEYKRSVGWTGDRLTVVHLVSTTDQFDSMTKSTQTTLALSDRVKVVNDDNLRLK